MKYLAANPDLGAKEDKKRTEVCLLFFSKCELSNAAKLGEPELQRCQESLTHSSIASMWNCYLDVCLHNSLVQRINSIIISTVLKEITNINGTLYLLIYWVDPLLLTQDVLARIF